MAMQNNLLLPHVPKSNEKTAHAGQEVQWQTPEGQSTQVSSLFDNVAHRINPSPVYSCASHQQQGQYERSTTTMLNLPTLPPFIMHSSSASTAAAAAAAASSGFGSASCISGGSTIVSISSSIPKEPIKCGASDQLRDDDDITLSPSPHHVLMPNKRRGYSIGGDRRSEDATEPDAKRRVVQSVSQNQKSYTDAQHDTGVVEKEASESMKKESSACTVNVGSNFHYVQVVGGGALNHRLTSKHGNDDDCRSLNSSSVSSIGAASSFSSSSVTLLCPKDTISSTSRLQDYLDDLLTSRGYRPKKIGALELGYRPQPPTPLQLASFGYAVCSITTKAALRTTKRKDSDGAAARLSALLGAGLSPNPTNKFGESPFFVACKHGSYSLVEAFVDAGAEVSVADSFGRTPLHYAAWADPPCIKSIRLLLEKRKKSCNNSAGSDNDENYNARLFYVSDVHGKTPLDFVGISHHGMWIEFLEGVKEELWPVREHDGRSDDQCNVEEGVEYCPYSRWKSKANVDRDDKSSELERNNDIPDPKDALSLELAQKVANGHMMPQEARRQHQEQLQHQRQQQPP